MYGIFCIVFSFSLFSCQYAPPPPPNLPTSAERQIGHWVLTRIFRGCHVLENVSLARCSRVGDDELNELGVGCRGLKRLDLRDCNQVKPDGAFTCTQQTIPRAS